MQMERFTPIGFLQLNYLMNENWERVLKIEWKFIVKEREKGDEKGERKMEGKGKSLYIT